jgi:serine/threonine protein phosphatase PrpC
MEDVIEVVELDNGGAIFIVLDGHNGMGSVDFVSKNLPRLIIDSPQFSDRKYQAAMIDGFKGVEKELYDYLVQKEGGFERLSSPLVSPHVPPLGNFEDQTRTVIREDFPKLTSGVVVCVVMIIEGSIYTAHVGDCRAILCHNDLSVTQLTADHNVLNPVERDRVKSLISQEGYVKGLMVTRSLGNYCLPNIRIGDLLVKVEGQLSEPSFSMRTIQSEDHFIVIASDGLYEVMSNEVVIDTVLKGMKRPSFSPSKSARELVDRAISRGSSDNVCVCLVMLSHFRN